MPYLSKLILNFLQILLVQFSTSQIQRGTLNGKALRDVLEDIMEDAGYKYIEEELSNPAINYTAVDGDIIVSELIQDLENLFVERLRFLDKLVLVGKQGMTSTSGLPECCKITNFDQMVMQPGFGRTTVASQACVYRSFHSPPSPAYPPESFVETAQEIAEQLFDNRLQFLSTDDGVTTFYPAPKDLCATADFRSYDHRYRPHYVGAVSEKHKSVALAIDTATAASATDMFLEAVEAFTHIVLHGLGAKDLVGLVTHPTAPTETVESQCYVQHKHAGTEKWRRYLSDAIRTLVSSDVASNYSAVMSKSIDHLKQYANEDLQPVIMFLTTSHTSVDDIAVMTRTFYALREVTWRISPVLLIYGITQNEETAQKLELMKLTYPGRAFVFVTGTIEDLINNTITYYRYLPLNLQATPFLTNILTNYEATGSKFGLSAPVIKDNQLLGVAVIDIDYQLLLSQIIRHVGRDHESYTFVFDETDGMVIQHPQFAFREALEQIHITQLETSEAMQEYFSIILQSHVDDDKPSATHSELIRQHPVISSLGDPFRNGVFQSKRDVVLYYGYFHLEMVRWAVCYVDVKGSLELTFPPLTALEQSEISFTYHRIDLDPQAKSYNTCYSHPYNTLKDKALTVFNPSAFKAPSSIQFKSETYEDNLKLYQDILDGKMQNTIFNDNLLQELSLTNFLNFVWTIGGLSYNLVHYPIRRYATFHFGSSKIYPGHSSVEYLNFQASPSYKKAMGNRQVTHITTPYLDMFGTEVVVTIAKAWPIPGSNDIFGVLGVDISLNVLQNFLQILFWKDCFKDTFYCFLTDSSGYVLFHENWSPFLAQSESEMANIHIIAQEPLVAQDLFDNKYMTKSSCVNRFEGRTQYFYQLEFDSIDRKESANYKAVRVQGVDAFLFQRAFIANEMKEETSSCWCAPDAEPECVGQESDCECPCYNKLPASACTIEDAKEDLPCLTNFVATYYLQSDWKLTSKERSDHLCHGLSCRTANSSGTCYNIGHCRWCTDSSIVDRIKHSCESVKACPIGNINQLYNSFNHMITLIASITGGVMIVLFVSLCIYLGYHEAKNSQKPSQEDVALDLESTTGLMDKRTAYLAHLMDFEEESFSSSKMKRTSSMRSTSSRVDATSDSSGTSLNRRESRTPKNAKEPNSENKPAAVETKSLTTEGKVDKAGKVSSGDTNTPTADTLPGKNAKSAEQAARGTISSPEETKPGKEAKTPQTTTETTSQSVEVNETAPSPAEVTDSKLDPRGREETGETEETTEKKDKKQKKKKQKDKITYSVSTIPDGAEWIAVNEVYSEILSSMSSQVGNATSTPEPEVVSYDLDEYVESQLKAEARAKLEAEITMEDVSRVELTGKSKSKKRKRKKKVDDYSSSITSGD